MASLRVEDLTFRYKRGSRLVLEKISIEAKPSGFLALLGPNGSGKSTLLKIMAGQLPLRSWDKGRVFFDDRDFMVFSTRERAQKVAYVPSQISVGFPLTAFQAVMMGRAVSREFKSSFLLGASSKEDQDAVVSSMELCGCDGLRGRLLQELSSGEKQLVFLARAIAQGAKILLLDEALSEMDLHHQSQVGRALLRLTREKGYAVVLVAHDVNLAAEWASDCILMKQGRMIATGRCRETLDQDRLSLLYPGSELFVGTSPTTGAPKVFFA